MANEQNEQVVRRNFECWNGDLAALDETVAPDAQNHDPAMPEVAGPDGFKGMVESYRAAFPDLRMEIVDIVSDGDKVVTRWRAAGTNSGELMGMPATGRSTTVEGISIDLIRDGMIAESWTQWDNLGMMQQLGLAPDPQAATAAAAASG